MELTMPMDGLLHAMTPPLAFAPPGASSDESDDTAMRTPDESALSLVPREPRATAGNQGLVTTGVVLGLLLLAAGLLHWHRHRLVRPEVPGSTTKAAKGTEEVRRLMAEAQELTDRLAGVLDAKAAELEKLIAQADRAAAGLAPGSRPRPVPPEPLQAQVYRLADEGLGAGDIARRVGQPQGHVELMLNLRRS